MKAHTLSPDQIVSQFPQQYEAWVSLIALDTLPPTPNNIEYRTPSPSDFAPRQPSPQVQESLMHNIDQNNPLDSWLSGTSAAQISENTGNTRPSLPLVTTNEGFPTKNVTMAHGSLEHMPNKETPNMQIQESGFRQDQLAPMSQSPSPETKSRGSVILFHWQHDENRNSILLQLNKLAKVFQEIFQFHTEIWAIPDQTCQFQVHIKILEFVQKSDEGALLVVYYAGLGRFTDHYRLEWVRYVYISYQLRNL